MPKAQQQQKGMLKQCQKQLHKKSAVVKPSAVFISPYYRKRFDQHQLQQQHQLQHQHRHQHQLILKKSQSGQAMQ